MFPSTRVDGPMLAEALALIDLDFRADAPKPMQEHARIVGALGEVAATEWLRSEHAPVTWVHEASHDLEGYTAGKVEIKSKRSKHAPNYNLTLSVPAYNHAAQPVDWYLFTLVGYWDDSQPDAPEYHTVWILGGLHASRLEHMELVHAGDPMPQGGRFAFDSWQVPLGDLTDPYTLLRAWAHGTGSAA